MLCGTSWKPSSTRSGHPIHVLVCFKLLPGVVIGPPCHSFSMITYTRMAPQSLTLHTFASWPPHEQVKVSERAPYLQPAPLMTLESFFLHLTQNLQMPYETDAVKPGQLKEDDIIIAYVHYVRSSWKSNFDVICSIMGPTGCGKSQVCLWLWTRFFVRLMLKTF